MKKRLFGALALFEFMAIACSDQQVEDHVNYKFLFDSSPLMIQIDENTVGASRKYQLFETDDDVYLAFLNDINSSIKVYKLDSLNGPHQTIYFETMDGPNSINGELYFFEILDKDSILIMTEFSGGIMFVVNWEGEIKQRINIPLEENLKTNYFPALDASATAFQLEGRKLLFPYSVSSAYSNAKGVAFIYNLEDSTVKYGNNELSYYSDFDPSHIGGKEFFKVSMTYNEKSKKFLMTRPLDNRVYELNQEMEVLNSVDVPTKGYEEFKQLRKTKDRYRSNEKEFLYHRYGNSKFSSITYDKWKNVYYRVMVKGYSKEELDRIVDNGELLYASFSITVLDEQLNTIYEHHVESEEDLSYNEFFVSPKGLSFRYLGPVDEDVMRFKTFGLKDAE